MFKTLLPLFLLLLTVSILPQEEGQTFLSLKDTGVEEFIQTHPEYDGRGTIILILDTGVDMGIDGLTKTSTGEVKVIDVRDFTGEGDMPLYEADLTSRDGKDAFENDDMKWSVLADKTKMLPSTDDKYWMSVLNETHLMNSNSGSQDLNGNGKGDDNYFMVTYKASAGYWVVYFDKNGNNDLSDETPLRSYSENYDAFTIANQKGLPPLTMGLNVYPDEKRISLFMDDGSHGTHCAGIAAGYNIGGAGINGVAPGAKLMGLKIGHDCFPGGATVTESMKKAYLYADSISKSMKTPCIISMSFGIGTEIEARSELEKFLTNLAKNNPYLYISTSNGNEGPGISSTGLPSACGAIFSSGAVLTEEIARDNYGSPLGKNMVLHFSSRGGEVSKPDVLSPGAATSTVPNFSGSDKFWGTSMACPYTSGVMSLLLSAAEKEFPGVRIPARLLYKAIREGAVKQEGYTVLDQGAGYINVVNAWEVLKKYLKNNEISKFETYTITSTAPNQPDNQSRNLYIRDGSYLTGDEVLSFVVKRDNTIKSDKFYRVYDLKEDADWLIPVQKKTYIRNDQAAVVNVRVDKSKMKEPGLYTAQITAYRDQEGKSAEVSALRDQRLSEFDMIATVIIPYEFTPANDFKMMWKDQSVEAGMIKRYFIEVPAGQTAMKVTLSRDASSNKYSRCRYFLHDNNGIGIDASGVLYSVNKDEKIGNTYYDLAPGVYELDIDGYFLAAGASYYNLAVEFLSIQAVSEKEVSPAGKRIEFINYFNEVHPYQVSAEILGYEHTFNITLDGSGTYKLPFTIHKEEASKEFSVTMEKEEYGKITDFSTQILNDSGKAIVKNSLSYRTGGEVAVEMDADKDSVSYTLELVPGLLSKDMTMNITVKEVTTLPSPVSVTAAYNGKSTIALYPNNVKYLDFEFGKPEFKVPEGEDVFGKVYFKSPATGEIEYETEIEFEF